MSQDYWIAYVTQWQLRHMDGLFAYFQAHHTPEYRVRLQGVDYALIYAVPIEGHIPEQPAGEVAGNKLTLYGYRLAGAQPGLLRFILVWQNRGMSREDGLWAAVQASSEMEPPRWQACALAPGFSLEEARPAGALLESLCELETADLRPGIYGLRLGLGPAAGVSGNPNQPEGMLDLLAAGSEWQVSVAGAAAPTLAIPGQE
jgi:hypothetical protein